ncbi:nod factor export ATP-binding protein I-like [Dermacentor andersoni]|uniref:nod factor export ATP-binding protein I-like n=1 Tax=Dermacentor andersoni TaxID=34620 RepID=UPI003B3A5F06
MREEDTLKLVNSLIVSRVMYSLPYQLVSSSSWFSYHTFAVPQNSRLPLGVPAAVTVRDLRLQYSSRAPPVINGANLTVPKGVIYGLLGASGCGKTSLLKCLVGLCKPNSGMVLVFGKQLHRGLVPGPAVGFMPQELALHEDFTIAENMYFFGQLLGMPWELIYTRINFLCSFFQLLPANRFVENLSHKTRQDLTWADRARRSPPAPAEKVLDHNEGELRTCGRR